MEPLLVRWLGRLPYAQGLELQQALTEARRDGAAPDTLLLLEHEPVVTVGRSARAPRLRVPESELRRRGIEIHETGRGGDVTYHGPGQLVGYPIVALTGPERDAHRYLRRLERALIDAVAGLGVRASRVAGLTGIWVGDDKLAAIGVRLSTGWVTSHGFALNVGGDLSGFDTIVPCGIADRGVTALARLLPAPPTLREMAARVAVTLAAALARRPALPALASERLGIPGAPTLCYELQGSR